MARGHARDRPLGRASSIGFRGASEVPKAVPQTRVLVGFSTKRDDAGNIAARRRRDSAPEHPRWAIAPKMKPRWARIGEAAQDAEVCPIDY